MNLNAIVKQFFVENDFDKLAQNISVVRNDGVVIFSNSENFNESYTVGALVGGLWQAADALNSMVSKDQSVLEYRLSFDTSEQGIYVLPFSLQEKVYFICAIYNEVSNPALLKRNLRNLKDTLYFYLKEISFEQGKTRNGFLFEHITDEEIDRLFKISEL
jgi:hypothetical protein